MQNRTFTNRSLIVENLWEQRETFASEQKEAILPHDFWGAWAHILNGSNNLFLSPNSFS